MKLRQYASATELEFPNGATFLVSYSTPVAAHVPGRVGALIAEESYSRTTSKHIAAFLKRNGLTYVRASRVPQSEIAELLNNGGKEKEEEEVA